MTGPVLRTDRLLMHPHGLDDFADSLAFWSDPEATRYIGRPLTEEEAWARLMRHAGFWALLGFGSWVVREREGRRFVGEVGFLDGRRGLGPRVDSAPEIGWGVSPALQGRGYAGEAVAAALAWNDRRTEGGRTVCLVHPENAPSLRIAERAGFRRFAETTLKDVPALLLERL